MLLATAEKKENRWFGACSDAGAVSDRRGEDGAEPEGEAFDLLVLLHPNPHLWS